MDGFFVAVGTGVGAVLTGAGAFVGAILAGVETGVGVVVAVGAAFAVVGAVVGSSLSVSHDCAGTSVGGDGSRAAVSIGVEELAGVAVVAATRGRPRSPSSPVNSGDKVGRVGVGLLSIGDLIVYHLPSFIGL